MKEKPQPENPPSPAMIKAQKALRFTGKVLWFILTGFVYAVQFLCKHFIGFRQEIGRETERMMQKGNKETSKLPWERNDAPWNDKNDKPW